MERSPSQTAEGCATGERQNKWCTPLPVRRGASCWCWCQMQMQTTIVQCSENYQQGTGGRLSLQNIAAVQLHPPASVPHRTHGQGGPCCGESQRAPVRLLSNRKRCRQVPLLVRRRHFLRTTSRSTNICPDTRKLLPARGCQLHRLRASFYSVSTLPAWIERKTEAAAGRQVTPT